MCVFPLVLVLEVNGQQGQFPLPCLDLKAEMTTKSVLDQNIFWRKNGVAMATRGNTFLVRLEESFGGGNYTCHSGDGALLNHTLVLLQLEGSKRGAHRPNILLYQQQKIFPPS